VRLAAASGRLRRGGPRRVDLGQPAALGRRGQLRLARGHLAAGGAVRVAGCGAPGPGPGRLPGAGGGLVLDLPRAPASAGPASTVEVAMVTASISLRGAGRTFGATRALAGVELDLDPEVPAERTGIRRQLGYQPQEVGFPRGFTAFAFVDYIALLKEWTQPA